MDGWIDRWRKRSTCVSILKELRLPGKPLYFQLTSIIFEVSVLNSVITGLTGAAING